MRAQAPGKLVLTGAYAVLEGAPAVVVAVDRHAVADTSRAAASPPAEVRAAFGRDAAPEVDVSALQDARGRKLGLGSSAAAVVASLGARALGRGEDLAAPGVREAIFEAAREAHARVQSGGSGVDVAASTFGGALRYALGAPAPSIRAMGVPRGLVVATFFSGESARTSDLRARVDDARSRRPAEHAAVARAMHEGAFAAADAFEAADVSAYVRAAAMYGELLDRLGRIADAPIVPVGWAALAERASSEGGAFLPSGAGGGDVAVWLGGASPSAAFQSHAATLGLQTLSLSVDAGGLRPAAPAHAHA
jgi:phosphomevalonate kinase